MKHFAALLTLLACLSFAPGCSSVPKTPARIAFNTTASAIVGGDAAISAWSEYVRIENARIAKLSSKLEANKAKAKLDASEASVESAYEKYQDALKTAIRIGAAEAGNPGNVAAVVSEAAAHLISLVAKLTQN